MGGEGSMMQAIVSLRNNSRRSKREAFEGWTSSDMEIRGIKIEPISEETLQEIRDTLRIQRKKAVRKNIIALVLGIIIATFSICLLFAYFQYSPGISDSFLH